LFFKKFILYLNFTPLANGVKRFWLWITRPWTGQKEFWLNINKKLRQKPEFFKNPGYF